MVAVIPQKIKSNIERLLVYHSSGLPADQFIERYKNIFLSSLNPQDLGFETLQAFLLSLNETVLHLRVVNQKLFVYPKVQYSESEHGNQSPQIAELCKQNHELYPADAIGPKANIPFQEIPPEATRGKFLEVLVAEVYTPHNFWVQLRGEKTHIALEGLMSEIQEFYEQEVDNYQMPKSTIRVGQYCVAPYNEEYHRAFIICEDDGPEVEVRFIDYGTSSKISKENLSFMHQKFAKFPIQAIKAKLTNLLPPGGATKWQRSASQRFLELVLDKNLVAIISSIDLEKRVLDVALVDTSGKEDVHINDVLQHEGLAEYATKKTQQQQPQALETQSQSPKLPKPQQQQPQALETQSQSPKLPKPQQQQPQALEAQSQSPKLPKPQQQQPQALETQSQSPKLPKPLQQTPEQTKIKEKQEQQPEQESTKKADCVPAVHKVATKTPPPGFPTGTISKTEPTKNTEKLEEVHQPQPSVPLAQNVVPVAKAAESFYDMAMSQNNSFMALASMFIMQQLPVYEQYYRQQQMLHSLMLLDPKLALLVSPHLATMHIANAAAMLTSPYSMQMMNPPFRYTPAPLSETMTDNVLSTASEYVNGASNTSNGSELGQNPDVQCYENSTIVNQEQQSPATKESKLVSLHTEMNEPSNVRIEQTPLQKSKMCVIDVPCDKQETKHEEESGDSNSSNTNIELSQKPSKETISSEDSCMDQWDLVENEAKESKNTMKPKDLNAGGDATLHSVGEPEDVYKSEEDEEDEDTDIPPHFVKQVEIAKRITHLINVSGRPYYVTDEIVRLFTDFSGRHVILKILESKNISLSFCEIQRTTKPNIFEELEKFDIPGVLKSEIGYIVDKVHLIPLSSVQQFLTVLNRRSTEIFRAFQDEMDKFNPNDPYWTGSTKITNAKK